MKPKKTLFVMLFSLKGAGPAPVLVFLHGGGFVRGDKGDGENVCMYFARHGIPAVTMNYRFAPEIRWPQGAEDESVGPDILEFIKACTR